MMMSFLVPHPPLIVPGVGKGDEIPATREAYTHLAEKIAAAAPDTVVIMSPHSICYADYFHISPGTEAFGDFGSFHAPHIRFSVKYDAELSGLIGTVAGEMGLDAGFLSERDSKLDHGFMVPLYFLEQAFKERMNNVKFVRIGLSGCSFIDHYRFGMAVRRAAEQLSQKLVFVASGDMSHKLHPDGPYGFAKKGFEHDAFVRACVEQADFRKLVSVNPALCEQAAECGFRSLVALAGFMDGERVASRVLSYEYPFGVGYLTAEFDGRGAADSLLSALVADRQATHHFSADPYVRLAAETIELFVKTNERGLPALPADLPPEMAEKRAGVFVSVKKNEMLRGCIGTIAPTQKNIAREIIENAVAAVSRDPRFPPVEADELDDLSYSVDVLSDSELVSSPAELDAARYGVIVSRGGRRGLLLPNLEGVDTVEEQIAIALRKGGIGKEEPYTLERFEVVRHV